MMSAAELRKKSEKDLHKFVADKREELLSLIRDKRVSEPGNVREARGLRKDIARALTVINELRHAKKEEN